MAGREPVLKIAFLKAGEAKTAQTIVPKLQVYLLGATIAFGLSIVLGLTIPKLPSRQPVPYARLLGSVFTSVARHPAALVTLLITGASFAVFSMFWTALTFLLSADPFHYTTSQIGLMGLAGLAGAIASRRAGIMHDKGWSVPATGAALGLLALSLIGAWFAQSSIIGLVVAVIVLDIAVMVNLILGQTRLVSLSDTERSRLNTAFVVFNFMGGALGSFLAGPLWSAGGWSGIMVGALVLTAAGLRIWAGSRARLVVKN
ncbi:MFS transporter [Gemmobacter caeruleus]|uniref:MFS transporter n=1 Tax=Gemmobacter caeruleus TaxID=2595004 RepID=UPI0011EE240C|nr:MFS transporter [Gemmobacter caeruleus]